MRMLAYGAPGDQQDDYARMAESTALECLYKFCRAVVGVFGGQYLRSLMALVSAPRWLPKVEG